MDLTKVDKCAKGLHWMNHANTIFEKTAKGVGFQRRCRACNNARRREEKKVNRAREKRYAEGTTAKARAKGLAGDDPRHGTETGYNYWACRCNECIEAATEAKRLRRLKTKARSLGIDVDAICPPRSTKSMPAVLGFQDYGGSSAYAHDPVGDEAAERMDSCQRP